MLVGSLNFTKEGAFLIDISILYYNAYSNMIPSYPKLLPKPNPGFGHAATTNHNVGALLKFLKTFSHCRHIFKNNSKDTPFLFHDERVKYLYHQTPPLHIMPSKKQARLLINSRTRYRKLVKTTQSIP